MVYKLNKEQKHALKQIGITEKMLKYSKYIRYDGGNYVEKSDTKNKSSSKSKGKAEGKKIKFLETIKSCENINDIKKYKNAFNLKDTFIKELNEHVKIAKPKSYHNLFRFLKAYNKNSLPDIQKALHLYFNKDIPKSIVKDIASGIEKLNGGAQDLLKVFNMDQSKKDLTSLNKRISAAKDYSDKLKKFDISKLKSEFETIKNYIEWYANNMETHAGIKHNIMEPKIIRPLSKVSTKNLKDQEIAKELYKYLKLFQDNSSVIRLNGYHEPAEIKIVIKITQHIVKILKELDSFIKTGKSK